MNYDAGSKHCIIMKVSYEGLGFNVPPTARSWIQDQRRVGGGGGVLQHMDKWSSVLFATLPSLLNYEGCKVQCEILMLSHFRLSCVFEMKCYPVYLK